MAQGAKPILAVDVDEVLFPLVQLFVDYHNSHHGTDAKFEQFYTYAFEHSLDLSLETYLERLRAFAADGNFATALPIEESKKAIGKLVEVYDLQIVTSRWEEWQQDTIAWLQDHYPGSFSDVHFANSITWKRGVDYEKSTICERIGAAYFIDDSLENCTKVAASGIPSLLFGDFPWNQAQQLPENVQRVKDWDEVLEVLL